MPFGYTDAEQQAILPMVDAATSRQRLVLPDSDEDIGFELLDLMRAGQSVIHGA